MDPTKKAQERVAKNIAALRKRAGLTQAEVANATGMQPSNYQRIEYGGQNLTIETMVKIASALGVDPGDFWK